MPGTGTYTQDEVDAMIASVNTELNLKATRAELSAQGQQDNNRIQNNINDLTIVKTDIRNAQGDIADLMRRVLAVHTHSVGFHQETGAAGTHTGFNAPNPLTVGTIDLYIDAGSASINVVRDATGDLLNSALTGIAGTWTSAVPDLNAGFATGESLSYRIDSAAGVGHLQIQVDYTVD